MVERGKHLRFPPESRKAIGIRRERVRQDLEGDVAIELRIASSIDLTHAAGADERDDLVRTEPGAGRQRHEEARPSYTDDHGARPGPVSLLPIGTLRVRRSARLSARHATGS